MPISPYTVDFEPSTGIDVERTTKKRWADRFPGTTLDTTKWEVVQADASMTVSVSGGNLNIASGTTANATTIIRSTAIFRPSIALQAWVTLSQRIANQSFYVELISVDPITGQPDGMNDAGWLLDGTLATNAKYEVQNAGQVKLTSTAQTIPTTASPGALLETNIRAMETWFSAGNVDSANGWANTYRRHQQHPDPSAFYKVQIRVVNGASAPASTTTLTVGFVAVEEFNELHAEITAGSGAIAPGMALPVIGTGSGGRVDINIANASASVGISNASGSAALADSFNNPSVGHMASEPFGYNGTNWDRIRNNNAVSMEASSAKTASGNSASALTNFNHRGLSFIVNVSAVSGTSPTLVVKLQEQDPVSATWVDVPGAATATLSATGQTLVTVYPGIAEAANSKVSFPLGRTFRFAWVIGGTTPSFTFSIGGLLIV